MTILTNLKMIVSYLFLIGKRKNFDVIITFRVKNIFLKKNCQDNIFLYEDNIVDYFSWFEIKAKEIVEEIIHSILELW